MTQYTDEGTRRLTKAIFGDTHYFSGQLSLLDTQLAPAHNGTPTSVAAAVAATPKGSPQKRRILDYFEHWLAMNREFGEAPGVTQDETSIYLNLPRSTVCARFNELEHDGLIRKTQETRPTRYGRAAAVYVLTGASRRPRPR